MSNRILRASPAILALTGLAPIAIAATALMWAPTTGAGVAAFSASVAVAVAMVLAWCWVVGIALHRRAPTDLRWPTTSFAIATAYLAGYTTLFAFTVGGGPAPWPLASPALYAALHLVAMVAMLRILHFVGHHLRLVEGASGNETGSSWIDVATLISVGGVLAIQRRVNDVFADTDGGSEP